MKVLCRLPNAASIINGVKFIEHKLGMVSEEIEDSVAEHFLKIEGYLPFAPKKAATASTPAEPPAPGEAEGDSNKSPDATDTATADAAAAADAASKANAAK